MSLEPAYPITVVARRTGLSAHQIRVWERRYQAVVPRRSAGGHRLYAESDVERLLLLHQAIAAGHHIGQLAGLEADQLLALVCRDPGPAPTPPGPPATAEHTLARCIGVIQHLDTAALEAELTRAHAEYGHHALVEHLIAPLMTQVGELWHQDLLPIASEHLASAVVRSFMARLNATPLHPAGAPVFVATTPAGQQHDLGALLAAHTALACGWQALFLGADLPTEQIAWASRRSGALAVGLSLSFPTDDPRMAAELVQLRRALGPEVALLVGGRAAPLYREALLGAGAIPMTDLGAFRQQLEKLRAGR
ncbi:MAG: MerR family transcriptional regulator [Candidatus Latescibacteria bacterium]|nr:MerR family transcriptional regulator [Candidatus Latescibacterota bacterium]